MTDLDKVRRACEECIKRSQQRSSRIADPETVAVIARLVLAMLERDKHDKACYSQVMRAPCNCGTLDAIERCSRELGGKA